MQFITRTLVNFNPNDIMNIIKAEFLVSNSDYLKCPTLDKPEYAFIGRSNVGKSSLINMLTNNQKLAKTSGKPGKTQLINHFKINDDWYLVDLPGYGWAKVSKESRAQFNLMIRNYILHRENLFLLFVLIDSRHEPQQVDLDFINWLGENGIPIALVFTKADKQSTLKTQQNIELLKTTLSETWEKLPDIIATSSVKKTGREELLNYIMNINQQSK